MEQQVEIEIVTETTTAQYGTLTVGAILRTGTSYAAHLVDEHRAARYVPAKPAVAEGVPNAQGDADVQTSAQNAVAPPAQSGEQSEQPGSDPAAAPPSRKRTKAAPVDGGKS